MVRELKCWLTRMPKGPNPQRVVACTLQGLGVPDEDVELMWREVAPTMVENKKTPALAGGGLI